MKGKNPFGFGRRKAGESPADERAGDDATDPMMRAPEAEGSQNSEGEILLSTTAGRIENRGGRTIWIAGNLPGDTLSLLEERLAGIAAAALPVEEYTEIGGAFAVAMPGLTPLGEYLRECTPRPAEAFQAAVDLLALLAELADAGLAPASIKADSLFCAVESFGATGALTSFRIKFAAFHELVKIENPDGAFSLVKDALELAASMLDCDSGAPWQNEAATRIGGVFETLSEAGAGINAKIALQYLLDNLGAPSATFATDVGKMRTGNEDCAAVSLSNAARPLSCSVIAFVADGMGGHAAGEIASRIAASAVFETLTDWRKSAALGDAQVFGHLERTFRRAGEEIAHETALNPSRRGMGTTLTGILASSPHPAAAPAAKSVRGFEGARVWGANLGDSRTYIACSGGMVRLSRDHSEVQRMLDAGEIGEDEAFAHPMKNIITKCLGGAGTFADSPDVYSLFAGPGDLLLLASDGLSDMLRDEEIFETLAAAMDDAPLSLEYAAKRLIEAANEKGGKDNITVALVLF